MRLPFAFVIGETTEKVLIAVVSALVGGLLSLIGVASNQRFSREQARIGREQQLLDLKIQLHQDVVTGLSRAGTLRANAALNMLSWGFQSALRRAGIPASEHTEEGQYYQKAISQTEELQPLMAQVQGKLQVAEVLFNPATRAAIGRLAQYVATHPEAQMPPPEEVMRLVHDALRQWPIPKEAPGAQRAAFAVFDRLCSASRTADQFERLSQELSVEMSKEIGLAFGLPPVVHIVGGADGR